MTDRVRASDRIRATERARATERVRVTSPRMSAVARPEIRPATREIDEETEVGEVYLKALLRSQLRPALVVLGVVLGGLGGLPLFFLALPEVADTRVGPVTVAWIVLGVAVFPLLFVAAWWHVRAVERAERDFTEILRRR
ncbi:hypothetical protein GCM10022223_27890 [Kineosporia mesophila]|uniref:DUF485 domain-containing protein n=1 Tax=Kineosporia mesophila TaxID=566012 RepID=A0ABP6ZHX0_9ACTN|nr:hypothetical protein [Kineosporia mesophila]MCD5353478.1 hypothetical protein [Kineosporia mesophila]